MDLKQLTIPDVEPVSLAEAKAWCKIEISDDDDIVTSLIPAARKYCEDYTRRSFITTQWKWTLDAGDTSVFNCWNQGIYLPVADLVSVDSFQYSNATGTLTTWDDENYVANLGSNPRISPAFGKIYPLSRNVIGSIVITFTAGYGDDASDVPKGIKTAIKMLVLHLYQNRSLVESGPLNEVPATVNYLLNPYCWGKE